MLRLASFLKGICGDARAVVREIRDTLECKDKSRKLQHVGESNGEEGSLNDAREDVNFYKSQRERERETASREISSRRKLVYFTQLQGAILLRCNGT